MIWSERHDCLFLQVPHTACSAVAREMIAHYGGEHLGDPVHTKHAPLETAVDFLGAETVARAFKFCGVRHPLDVIVTRYQKFADDHGGEYSDPANHAANGGWIGAPALERFAAIQAGRSFSEDLRQGGAYVDAPMATMPAACDFVMRYESLQDDFAEAVRRFGADLVRPLPRTNPTRGKRPWKSYYGREDQVFVRERMTEALRAVGYDVPEDFARRRPLTLRRIAHGVRRRLGRPA